MEGNKLYNPNLPVPQVIYKNIESKNTISEHLIPTIAKILNKTLLFDVNNVKNTIESQYGIYDGFNFNFYDKYLYDKLWIFLIADKETCALINSQISCIQKLKQIWTKLVVDYDLNENLAKRSNNTVSFNLWMCFTFKWCIYHNNHWNAKTTYDNKLSNKWWMWHKKSFR